MSVRDIKKFVCFVKSKTKCFVHKLHDSVLFGCFWNRQVEYFFYESITTSTSFFDFHIFHNTQLHYQCLEKSCKWSKGMFVPRFSDLLKQPFPSQFFHTRNQWLYHLNVPRKFNFFWQSYDFCWLSNTHVHDVLLYSHIFLIYVACIVWNFIYH